MSRDEMRDEFAGWTSPPENEKEAFRRILNLYEECFEHHEIGMQEAIDGMRSIAKREYQRIYAAEKAAACRPVQRAAPSTEPDEAPNR